MADNEDVLMQFTAQDDVSSVIEAMESSVTAALASIVSTMDELDIGLLNLSSSSDNLASAFGELESSFDSAETSASNLQSTLDTISGDNIIGLQGDMDELSSSISDAESELSSLSDGVSQLDGTTVDINMETSSIGGDGSTWDADTELGGEVTEQDTSALRTSMYDDMVGMSNTIKELGDTAVESASAAEQGWLRFGNAVNNTGGNWEAQSESIKAWVKDYSNSMGRGVADTRTAMTTYLNMGMSLEETQEALKVTSSYAAQFGISQAEASKMMQMSFMGAGRSVKKLGLDIKDFKDEAGNVDKEKLMQTIMEKTTGASEKYADTYEARVQRMNNAINSLRTDFGKEIINTIEPLIPIVQQAVQAFGSLPQPVKSAVLGFAGLAGGAAIVAGPFIKMRAYMNMAGVEMSTVSRGLKTLRVGFQSLSSGGLKQAITNMKTFSDIAKKTGNTNFKVAGPSTPLNLGGTGQIAKNTTTVVKDASTVGALAPEAEAAAAGTTATGGAMSGIATAFTSMIVPLLAIAAVVAVMIPIIAGLAAEALIFIKGIQLLIDALDFDKIDLIGAIEGIKQVGQAMLEIGIAMAEMTFANIMTGLAVLTTGIPGLINPIQIAGQMLVQAAKELQVFNTVNIDPSIPANIKSISNALKLVADSMGSLTTVVMSMALGNIMTLGGLLGNVSTAITTAKNEITHAANEIATLKTLPDIDQGAVDKLKKVSDSLSSVAEAMEALRSLRDAQNWDNLFSGISDLFGGVDIQSALYGIRDDLYKASASLAIFKDMSNVPQGVGTKLKAVADALKSVSESIESLRKLRDDYNWDSSWGNIFQGTDIPGAINAIRADLFKVSASLRTLNDMSAIPEGTGQKIQRVAWTTNNVISAVNSLKNLNSQVDGNVDLTNVVSSIDKANSTLRQVASRLRSLSTIANIPEGLGTKIRNITNTTNQLKGSISAMNGIPQTNEGTSQRVQKAVDSVRKVATQLNRLQGTSVSGGIGQVLSSVRTAINQLKTTLSESSGGFKTSGVSIGNNIRAGVGQGMNNLTGTVRNRVSSATGAGASAAWTGGARMGNSATRGFQSAFKIANIAGSEVTYATQAIQNGTGAFVQAVGSMAEQAVQEAKNKLDQQSPGRIARMWGAEMGFSREQILSKGGGLIEGIGSITRKAISAGEGSINMGSAFTTDFNVNRLNSVNAMNKPSDMGKQQRPVNIIIGAGAIQLDARNLTTKESRQIMINALEGLEVVNGIDINGV